MWKSKSPIKLRLNLEFLFCMAEHMQGKYDSDRLIRRVHSIALYSKAYFYTKSYKDSAHTKLHPHGV